MLTAAAHGKLKRRLDLREDEVTSCVFGAMQHLPIEVTWRILERLAKDAGISEDLFHTALPETVEFEFWPKWGTNSGYVEPDLVVHFDRCNAPVLHIVIEVKWGATLFPPCELVRQWGHRPADDKAPWLHLYLVKDSAMGYTEIEHSLSLCEDTCPDACVVCENRNMKKGLFKGQNFDLSEWQACLGCLGWRHTVNAIRDISQGYDPWVKGITIFFAKQGIVPFIGFKWLREKDLGNVSAAEMVLFHREPWFVFLKDAPLNCNSMETVFFVRGK